LPAATAQHPALERGAVIVCHPIVSANARLYNWQKAAAARAVSRRSDGARLLLRLFLLSEFTEAAVGDLHFEQALARITAHELALGMRLALQVDPVLQIAGRLMFHNLFHRKLRFYLFPHDRLVQSPYQHIIIVKT
jgi:hypothetical protein